MTHQPNTEADRYAGTTDITSGQLTDEQASAYHAEPDTQCGDPAYGPEHTEHANERRVRKGARKYSFRMIPDWILWHPELQSGEIVFYAKLMFLMGDNDSCTYSVPFMAAACGVTDRAVQKWERKLEDLGILDREFRKQEGKPKRNDNNDLALAQGRDQVSSR